MDCVMLYRPVRTAQLPLIVAIGFRRFPPRPPDQQTFYPVTDED